MTTQQITLPADVYDALELAAEAAGGIGGGRMYETALYSREADLGYPKCGVGAAHFAGLLDDIIRSPAELYHYDAEIRNRIGFTTEENDEAVERINKRLNRSSIFERVPFEEWAKELNIVRGDQ